jgi:hypothetical protein
MLGRRWRRNRFNEEERAIDVCGAEEHQRRVGYKFAERALSGTSASPPPPELRRRRYFRRPAALGDERDETAGFSCTLGRVGWFLYGDEAQLSEP